MGDPKLDELIAGIAARCSTMERKPSKTVAEPSPWTKEEHADAVRKKREELGLKVSALEIYLRQRGVPEKFWQAAQKPRATSSVALVERLLGGEGLLLVLGGAAGRGKSTAAAVALARRPGFWVNAPTLAKPPVKKRDAEDEDEETVRDGHMNHTPLLVLDEVGLEHSPSGYAASRIAAALSNRDAAARPTIVTTNLSSTEFVARYGERIASRLNGDPLGWQTVGGPDYRVELSRDQR